MIDPSANDSGLLRDAMINISIRLELPDLVSPEGHTFSVLSSTTVQALRCHVNSILRRSEDFKMFALIGGEGDEETKRSGHFSCLEKMDDESASLGYYGLKSGDVVVVRL